MYMQYAQECMTALPEVTVSIEVAESDRYFQSSITQAALHVYTNRYRLGSQVHPLK